MKNKRKEEEKRSAEAWKIKMEEVREMIRGKKQKKQRE